MMHGQPNIKNYITHVSDGLSVIVRSLRLYIHYQVYSYVIQVLWLLATGNEMELVPASKQPQNLL
jgi:hypothetical protein